MTTVLRNETETDDEFEIPCSGVGCSECKQLGCDRDYGDD